MSTFLHGNFSKEKPFYRTPYSTKGMPEAGCCVGPEGKSNYCTTFRSKYCFFENSNLQESRQLYDSNYSLIANLTNKKANENFVTDNKRFNYFTKN